MIAKEIMQREVVSARPQMTARELATLLLDRRITGMPVVDELDRPIGVVSQTDIVRTRREAPESGVHEFYGNEPRWLWSQGYSIETPDLTSVGEIMTPSVISAPEDASVEDLARTMLERRIHRIVITRRDGKIAGIVTSTDLLRALLAREKRR